MEGGREGRDLPRLHRVDNGSIPCLLIDQQVHVVVLQRRHDSDIHSVLLARDRIGVEEHVGATNCARMDTSGGEQVIPSLTPPSEHLELTCWNTERR